MNDPLLQGAWRAHGAGDLAEAARLYGAILRANPSHSDALYSFGFLRFQNGEFEDAEQLLAKAARVNPRSADVWFTRGCVLIRLKRETEALDAFDRALALRPSFVEAALNRGALLLVLKRPEDALQSFDAALAANPTMHEAWNNRGNALAELGRPAEAVESYDRALALKPGFTETLVNRGTALLAAQRAEEARASYDEAAAANPGSAEAVAGTANALFELKRYEEAGEHYARALNFDPDYAYGIGHLAFCRLHCCDWRSLEDDKAQITAGLAAGKRVINPFQSLALLSSEEAQQQAAQIWVADKYPPYAQPLERGAQYRHDRVRLAYLSADFNDHAVSTLMAGVFEQHDRERFETFAISFARSESAGRKRLEAAFAHFIDVSDMSDAEIAELLRAREIDIAVDLMGFTGECRPGIFARRPAPIQVNYLGFAGTMGAPYVDTIIADETVIPEHARRHYSERIVTLPACYLPADRTRKISQPKPSREEAGLPAKGFVFCSFNNSYKFTPTMFDIWMRLLRGVDGSVLWLPRSNPAAMRNLAREAENRGVPAERLVFAPFVGHADEHLARLALADLFLDALPYNAHATASDALWAGVPLVTCLGTTFAGRVAASALKALDLPELIAESPEAYEALALNFARDADALARVRGRLAANRETHALFDTARFTRDLEAAYLKLLAS